MCDRVRLVLVLCQKYYDIRKQRKPQYIPPNSWIGIPDLALSFEVLTKRLNIPFPIQQIKDSETSLIDSLKGIWKNSLIILPIHQIKKQLITVVGQIEQAYPNLLTVSLDPFYINNRPVFHVKPHSKHTR